MPGADDDGSGSMSILEAYRALLAADFHIHDPFHLQGQWHAQFPRPEQPLVLELGCGKGGFLSQLAAAHPENNYLGIDITALRLSERDSVVNQALVCGLVRRGEDEGGVGGGILGLVDIDSCPMRTNKSVAFPNEE